MKFPARIKKATRQVQNFVLEESGMNDNLRTLRSPEKLFVKSIADGRKEQEQSQEHKDSPSS
jgi:hypothetical protein